MTADERVWLVAGQSARVRHVMLFKRQILAGLADGTVTLAFRRWRRPRVRPGSRLRTPVGVLEIDAVDVVNVADITDDDARRAGFPSRGRLLDRLNAYGDGPVHRVTLHFAGPDPREELRQRAAVDDEELGDVARRLARLDAASRRDPWTMTVLRLIADHPNTRAADLAAALGRDKPSFKADVRKLKELGLTESLDVGYRLSPRGRTVVDRLHRRTESS